MRSKYSKDQKSLGDFPDLSSYYGGNDSLKKLIEILKSRNGSSVEVIKDEYKRRFSLNFSLKEVIDNLRLLNSLNRDKGHVVVLRGGEWFFIGENKLRNW